MKKKRSKKRRATPRCFSCPQCRASDKFRILPMKTVVDRLMALLGYHPILCVRCLQKFYAWPYRIKHEQRQKSKPFLSA